MLRSVTLVSAVCAVVLSLLPAATPAQSNADRGKYIVHHVAMCVQCHSPRDESGNLLQNQLLHGAPMPVKSPYPEKIFAFSTPRLAGLPAGFTEETLARFLQTGDPGQGRTPPRPPMPPFRMNGQDARAVAAYLKTVK